MKVENTSSRGFADELAYQDLQWRPRWASSAAPPIKELALSLIQEGLYLEVPAITGETVASAANQFKAKTAWGPDGLHVRQCALLSQPLLNAMATSMEIFSCAGLAPRQAMLVTAPLIPKPTGGQRPIGIFSAWKRLWSKTNRQVGRRWLEEYARGNPILAAVPGKTSVDPACRIAAAGQVYRYLRGGAGMGRFTITGVSVLLDLEKLFDQLPAGQAARYAAEAGVPRHLIRAAITASGWTRYLRAGPTIGVGVSPLQVSWRGTVAQCLSLRRTWARR